MNDLLINLKNNSVWIIHRVHVTRQLASVLTPDKKIGIFQPINIKVTDN